MMLPKERVIAALEFSRPDSIPVGETGIDYPITEQALGHATLYRAKWKEYTVLWQGRRDEYVASCNEDIADLGCKFEHDVVPAFLVPPRGVLPPQPEFLAPYRWRLPDGRVYAFTPESDGHAFLLSNPPVRIADIQEIPFEPDESQLELVRHLVKDLGGTHFILGRPGDGIFPIGRYTFDFLLLAMVEQPELARRIIEVEINYCIKVSEALLDAGCDAVLPSCRPATWRVTMGSLCHPGCSRIFCFNRFLVEPGDIDKLKEELEEVLGVHTETDSAESYLRLNGPITRVEA